MNFSHVEVAGEGLYPVIHAFDSNVLCKVLLQKYGLHDIQKGKFYPLTEYLALLKNMEKRMPTVLKRTGKFIMTEAIFPPGVNSLEQAFELSDQAYYMNHRGLKGDEIGHYKFKKISDSSFRMTASSLYPCVFDQGAFIGIGKKFNRVILVEHSNDNCRSKGDSHCDYIITVKK